MGNIPKIAALTALITLAFGITAIDVAMAKPELMMVIEIYAGPETGDNFSKLKPGAHGKPLDSAVTATGEAILKHNNEVKRVRDQDVDVRIIWTRNPCVWLKLNGAWRYVCY